MRRRRIIRAVGAVGAGALAGCVGGQPAPGDGSNGTPPSTGTPAGPSTSFTVRSVQCGEQVNRAEVTVEGNTVTVDGTAWGNDACYVGRLDSASLDGGTLTVGVVTESAAADDESCAQCITEIDYLATVDVSEPPEEVVVTHDGETVAAVRP